MHPTISIIIATFNSAQTLSLVLESIKNQTFPKNKIEVLIVDGGSTDETLELAKKYNCKVTDNPQIEPVSAKLLGYKYAKGDYILYLDADEVIENPESLSLKYSIFQKEKKIKAVIGSGYQDPKNASFITSYINDFGDPFSFFIYRLSKNSKYYYSGLKQLFPALKEDPAFVIFDFSKKGKGLLLELGAANSMMDLNYLRKQFPNFTSEIFAHLFQLLVSKANLIGMTKNDSIIHYATTDLQTYLNKINWRIKNNIYHLSKMGVSGFRGREQFHSGVLKLKKYLFIPYSLSLVFPLLDSLYLILSRKNLSYFFHFPLTIYIAGLITYHYFLKLLGLKPKLRSYDESTEIKSN